MVPMPLPGHIPNSQTKLFKFSLGNDCLPLPPFLYDRHLPPGQKRPLASEELLSLGEGAQLTDCGGSWVFLLEVKY